MANISACGVLSERAPFLVAFWCHNGRHSIAGEKSILLGDGDGGGGYNGRGRARVKKKEKLPKIGQFKRP